MATKLERSTVQHVAFRGALSISASSLAEELLRAEADELCAARP
jgi:hypothetical protein